MNNYAHPDFEGMLKEEANQSCFDCGKKPAQWASVNNAIYLCLNCAGVHRGFGVNISYIRSITMDSWNENQINLMKNGGNQRLRDLFKIYEINQNYSPELLYSTKLLDFYRKLLKCEISGEGQPLPPDQREALFPCEPGASMVTVNTTEKFSSVGSTQVDGKKPSYFESMNIFMKKAVDKGKVYAQSVKEKVNEMDLGTKVRDTGKLAYDKLKIAGDIVKEKGTEVAQSSTVQNMKKKANDGYNYIYGKIFGTTKQQSEQPPEVNQETIINSEQRHEINRNNEENKDSTHEKHI